jgi:hypothetical protein
MTILSVAEKTYNLFWNDKDWPMWVLFIGVALAITGIAILSNYRMDGIFGLVPLVCGIFLVGTLVFTGKQEKYQAPYNTYEVMLDESVAFVDPINKDFKIEPKEGETSIFTVTPISKTAKVPTFEVGEYINTKEYVNNESN